MLEKVHKKLQEADHTVEAGLTRTRVIQKKLKDVQELAPGEAQEVVDIEDLAPELAEHGRRRVERHRLPAFGHIFDAETRRRGEKTRRG